MLRSMTGFGAGSAEGDGHTVRVEAKSVNHRFLQVKVKAPSDWPDLEAKIEALAKTRLARGAVSISVHVDAGSNGLVTEVDEAAVERFAKAAARIAELTGSEVSISGEGWLRLPGVVREARAKPSPAVPELVLSAADAALRELVAMREREGEAMARDLATHAAELGDLRAKIGERAPELAREQLEKLRGRVQELLGPEQPVDPAELARELAILADRGDVAEELSRLDSHQDQLAQLLASREPAGRQLDFLVQECLREVNTIGSKTTCAQVAQWVIAGKTAIERLREQVQNVE